MGCQMNEYDSNRIFDITKKIDYLKTENLKEADCYVLNTCHIREKATEKVYHDVGRIKKEFRGKRKPIVVVAGCVAQAEGDILLKKDKYIDAVVGPQSYHRLNEIISKIDKDSKKINLTDFEVIEKFDNLNIIRNTSSNVSSFLTIQEGCNKFCKFCVVPYTRGEEYSRSVNELIKESVDLVNNGANEITLLGQNVNAYSFYENNNEFKISNLLNELEKFNELHRIRYTTSHPVDMTEDLIDCYKTNKKLMPFIHLPIQSGSDKVLKLMNRKHKVDDYINIYKKLIKINPSIKLSSDFIIGYPGEEKSDFEETMSLIKEIKFINSFSFIFSSRPGTKASKLKEVDNNVSKERLIELQNLLFDNQISHNKSLEHKEIDVLVENKIEHQGKFFGRNEYLNSVILEADEQDIGKILKISIEKSNQNTLFGKVINKMKAA